MNLTLCPKAQLLKPMSDETRIMPIGDILSKEQQAAVVAILQKPEHGIDLVRELKAYLAQFGAELEAKGVLSSYFAYLLLANKDRILASVNSQN